MEMRLYMCLLESLFKIHLYTAHVEYLKLSLAGKDTAVATGRLGQVVGVHEK